MSRRITKRLDNQTTSENALAVTSNRAIEKKEDAIANIEVKGDLKRRRKTVVYQLPYRYRKQIIRRPLVQVTAAILVSASLFLGIRYYLYVRAHESTDNAFIRADITQIEPQVAGLILKVYITDNQKVKQGDLLAEIDSSELQSKLAEAQAALEAAEAKHRAAQATTEQTQTTAQGTVEEASSGVTAALAALQTARAQADAAREREGQAQATIRASQAAAMQAKAQITAAEAEATRAAAAVQRYQTLHREGVVSQQQLEVATAEAKTANAQLAAARERAAGATAQVDVARAAAATSASEVLQTAAQVRQAVAIARQAKAHSGGASGWLKQVEANREQASSAYSSVEQARKKVSQAQLWLSYTHIYAPVSGRVTNRSVTVGNYVQPGNALMAIVTDQLWVEANFKETQITYMRPGQPVTITIDAYPDRTFRGKVHSIQSGSGATFSVLPPENAAGNYIKVTQRVPVKIVFDEPPDPNCPIGPGWSVVPEVKVR